MNLASPHLEEMDHPHHHLPRPGLMNFSTSLYSNATGGISKDFHVSKQAARVGAAIFLICYAFGCELWAPWSEEVGRWPIM